MRDRGPGRAPVRYLRRARAGVLATLLLVTAAACSLLPPVGGCSDAGCLSEVTFLTDAALAPGRRYTVDACAGDVCRTEQVRVRAEGRDAVVGRGDIAVAVADATVVLTLPEGDDGHDRDVTLRITDDTGAVVVDGAGRASFDDEIRPNGPWCGPVCFLAEVRV